MLLGRVLGDGSTSSLRYSSIGKRFRNSVAVDETVVKLHGLRAYVWSAVDIDYCYEVHQDGLG